MIMQRILNNDFGIDGKLIDCTFHDAQVIFGYVGQFLFESRGSVLFSDTQ